MTTVISRSELSTLQRCPRKWFYSYMLEGPQAPASKTMAEGTLGHIGLAAAYNTMRDWQIGKSPYQPQVVVTHALGAMQAAVIRAKVDYHGEAQALGLTIEDTEEITRMGDVVQHYLHVHGESDFNRYKILGVEVPFFSQEVDGVQVEGTLDLLAQDMTYTDSKVAVIFDHKFVADSQGAVEFLPFDHQMLAYEDMVYYKLVVDGDFDNVEIIYDCHNRSVPPGFGHRELRYNKDGTLSKTNATTDPQAYYKRHTLRHSKREREAIRRNLLVPLMHKRADLTEEYNVMGVQPEDRVVIKTGGESCGNCFHRDRCSNDMLGRVMPSFDKAVVSSLP